MDYMAILDCLEQKKALFDQYAVCTGQMRVCAVEELDEYLAQRARLAEEIDNLSKEIDSFCDMSDDPDMVRDAVANRGNYADFSRDLQYVYDQSSKIFTVINHIYNMEIEVTQRLKDERQNCLDKIKQGAGTAKMYGYVKNLQSNSRENLFLGNQKI